MGSKIRNFEIYLFYCIVLLPWPKTHHTPPPCNKDNSRLVRKIIRAKWIPILDKFLVKFPLECPLHPSRDIFAPRQDAKKRDRPTQWTCRLCGKSFYQEKFLDLHFEKRHKTCINKAEDSRCYGEMCDIFRCDVYLTDESSSLKTNDQNIVTDIEVWGDSFGQNSALAKANVAYLSLLPIRTSSIGASRAAKVQNRQLCQDKIGQTNCQQTETSNENYIYNNNGASRTKFMPQTPAESLTSSAAPHIYSSASSSSAARLHKASSSASSSSSYGSTAPTATSGGSSSTTTTSSTTATTKEPNTRSDSHADHNTRDPSNSKDSSNDSVKMSDNTSDMNSNKIFGSNGQQTFMQKKKANCNPEEMSILRAKCENLLRSCIGSLIHEMTEQNFKDMEEEMDKAVCWYLTCDRYWEDGPLEPRAFPWGLILILVFVLSSGVCFCYYIIWILFDSEETTINATANHHYYPQHQHQQQHQELPPEYRQHQHMYIPASHHQQQQQQQHQQQHHQSLMEDPYHFQEYPTTGIHRHGMTNADHPSSSNQYYYQQPSQQGAESTHPHDLYPEPVQYDYRHSPRRYIGDPRRPGTPTITMSTGVIGGTAVGGGGQTPLRHPQTNLAYQQDILDRRDYISSRPMATTVVSSHNTLASTRGPNTGSSGALSSLSHHSGQLDCDNTLPATHLGSSSSSAAGVGSGGGGGGVKHYNTIPRPLEPRQRYVSGSQQSLRASSSTHEIIQNEVGHNEHYIYVTYPPDLKKRFFEKYE